MTLDEWKHFPLTIELVQHLKNQVEQGKNSWLDGEENYKAQPYCRALQDVVDLIKEGSFIADSENL